MTEKLFTGVLSIQKKKEKKMSVISDQTGQTPMLICLCPIRVPLCTQSYYLSPYRFIFSQVLGNKIILVHFSGSSPLNHIIIIFFFIQFNVPFKIISLIETSLSIGGAKHEYPGKTT